MDLETYKEEVTELRYQAAALYERYGELPGFALDLWFWGERRTDEPSTNNYGSLGFWAWSLYQEEPAAIRYQCDRALWELTYYLGLPEAGMDRSFPQGRPIDFFPSLGYCKRFQDFAFEVFPDYLELETPRRLIDAFYEHYEDGDPENLPPAVLQALNEFSMALEQEIRSSVAYLQEARSRLYEQYWQTIEPLYGTVAAIQAILNPMNSQFLAWSEQGVPFFPFRDPQVQGIQVIPNENQANVATDPGTPIRVGTNLYDVLLLGFHTILSYLGAHRYPRPLYFPDDTGEGQPQWAIPNLADHVAELHQELRDISLCSFETRKNNGEKEEVYTTLNQAVGAIAGAVSEIALDAQRSHLLSAQAARTALTISRQIGTAVFPGTVDLGWRGQVTAPVTNAASIVQILASIESALNELSIALGVAPERRE